MFFEQRLLSETEGFRIMIRSRVWMRITGVTILGGILGYLYASILAGLWRDLEWRRPVEQWILDVGLGYTAVNCWNIIWTFSPAWLLGIPLGIVVGVSNRRTWLLASVLSGLAFLYTPELILLATLGQNHPMFLFGWNTEVWYHCWSSPTLLLAVVFAWLSSRRRLPKDQES